MDELEGPGADIAAALIDLFTSYGLGSLAPKIIEFVQQDYGPDTITLLLRETPEYKKRFIANERRRAAGLPELSPGEILQIEAGYRQSLQAAGLPAGFYDSHEDFVEFLVKDIAPAEVAERAQRARQVADTVDPLQRQVLATRGIDPDSLASFYLDPNRALPLLQKQVDVALLGAERQRAGFGFNEGAAETLFQRGVTLEEARAGYSVIAQALPTFERLGEIENDPFTISDFEDEVFSGDAEATQSRRRLASQERARFSGSSGTGRSTFSRDRTYS
jgi:hypothetical protein